MTAKRKRRRFKSFLISSICILLVLLIFLLTLLVYPRFMKNMLFTGIIEQDYAKVEKACRLGADVNACRYTEKDNPFLANFFWWSPTPLIAACRQGDQDIVRLLIENGADINKPDAWTHETPLGAAMSTGKDNRYELALYLIEQGADVTMPPVHFESSNVVYDSPVVDALAISENDSPETIAQGYELFVYLMEHDAPITVANNETLLSIAVYWNNEKAVRYILKNKPDEINAQNFEGKTPLILAIEGKNANICRLLLENGADVYIRDFGGKTALYYAKLSYIKEIKEMFADIPIK